MDSVLAAGALPALFHLGYAEKPCVLRLNGSLQRFLAHAGYARENYGFCVNGGSVTSMAVH